MHLFFHGQHGLQHAQIMGAYALQQLWWCCATCWPWSSKEVDWRMLLWFTVEHSPADPQRQGPGHEPCLTFTQRCSTVIHWQGCVIKMFSRNRLALIYDKRISRWRNQSKSLPSLKTTQGTAISNEVPQLPSLFSCCFHTAKKTQLRGEVATRKTHNAKT